MPVEIVFADGDRLVALVLDATLEERHRASAQATEHEVERGVAVTDHVRPERRVLTLDVVISDAPLGAAAPDTEPTRVVDAWATLLDARDRALLAVVTTRLETYEDMVLTEASTTRTAADGSWIRVEVTFSEVRQVATELVDDPVPERSRDHRQENVGSQATAEATPRMQSALVQGASSEFGQQVLSAFGWD